MKNERPVMLEDTPTYEQLAKQLLDDWSNGSHLSDDERAILLSAHPELEEILTLEGAESAA